MIKKRIIPVVLLDGFSVLKTIKFDERRNLGSPITVARTYNTRNVDELILLDIDASQQDRAIDAFTVQEVASECFMPLTVGGGIKSVDDMALVFSKGADKVAVNSAALDNPQLIADAARYFGSQSIVVSIDVIKSDGHYAIYKQGSVYTDIKLDDWCQQVAALGAGELLINSVDLDGTMSGGDVNLAGHISRLVNIPVIYNGGISDAQNCVEIGLTNIAAIGIASIFHFSSITPLECKQKMDSNGIAVRLK